MKRLLTFLLCLSSAPVLSAGVTDLIIPDSPAEMEKVLGDDAPCKGCGVVTDVRQQASAIGQDPAQDPTYTLTIVEVTRSGPGGDVEVTGAQVNGLGESSGGAWLITVRYDDGSYAVHENRTRPSLQQGDRVQVVSGQLVPR